MELKIVNLTKIDREKDSATQKLQILLIIFFPNSLSQSDNPTSSKLPVQFPC